MRADRSDGVTSYVLDNAGNRTRQTMTAGNHAPVALNISVSATADGSTVYIPILQRMTDEDGDRLVISILPPTIPQGTAQISPNGSDPNGPGIDFTAGPSVPSGSYPIYYSISDGRTTSSAVITVNVTNVGEIFPASFSASSAYQNRGYSGLTSATGMRDRQNIALWTMHVTEPDADAWIKADLGSVKAVTNIKLLPASPASGNGPGGEWYVNGADVQYSTNNVNWTTAATVSGATDSAYVTVELGNISARYIRLRRSSFTLALGDFRVYNSAVGTTPPSQPPVTNNSVATFNGNSINNPVALSVTGSPTAIAITTAPANGSATPSGATLRYTPNSNWSGVDTLRYTATNVVGTSAPPAKVDLYVRPVVASVSVSTPTATPVTIPLNAYTNYTSFSVTGAGPTKGSYSISGSNLYYTPNSGQSGKDTFSYKATSAGGDSDPATVEVTIGTAPSANRNPVATADYVTIPNGAATEIRVLDNDYDLDGDPLSITATRTVTNAPSWVNPNGTVTYSPTPGYTGADTLSYDLSDGRGGTATGAVILNVAARNDPPVAVDKIDEVNQSTTTTLLPLADDSDPGDTFLLNWVGPLQFVYGNLGTPTDLGSTTVSGNSVIYSAPFVCNCAARAYYHVVRFQYEVIDSRGQTSRAWHAINVYSQPTAANQNPVTATDNIAVTEGSTGFANVLANDSDPEGDTLSIIEITPPTAAHAFYSIAGSSIQIDYVSRGSDTVTYKISDGHGGTATGTLYVNLN